MSSSIAEIVELMNHGMNNTVAAFSVLLSTEGAQKRTVQNMLEAEEN